MRIPAAAGLGSGPGNCLLGQQVASTGQGLTMKNAGQRCDAASAVLVQELVADEFVSKV